MSGRTTQEEIELLGIELFETHQEEINIVKQFKEYFAAEFGWHYYLDLAWIIRQVQKIPRGALILDAGAGSGLLQFILAELGYNVISADFTARTLAGKYSQRYGRVLHYLNSQDRIFDNRYTRHLRASPASSVRGKVSMFAGLFSKKARAIDPISAIEKNRYIPQGEQTVLLKGDAARSCGRIFMYNCDLRDMPLLPNGFVDGIVSVSALEHNDHDDLEKCMDEILRVTKSPGRLLMTVSASLSEDWFHEPSKGWCFSEATIKRLFRLPDGVTSNFSRKDEIFKALGKEGNDLHKRLDPVYLRSGNNGMPWGKWYPKYLPVGVCKIKGYTA